MCLRLLQLLSAPNVLHDLHGLSGEAAPRRPVLSRVLPERTVRLLYLLAMERGFLDAMLDKAVVQPFLDLARRLSRMDARLCGAVLAAPAPEPEFGAGDE